MFDFSEGADNSRLLMVRPSDIYFKPREQDFSECFAKWSGARQALKDIGVQIFEYDSAEDYAPRSPYSRDKYLSLEGIAFIPDIDAAQPSIDTNSRGALANDQSFFRNVLGRVHKNVVVTTGLWFETGNLIIDKPEKTIFGGVHTMEDLGRLNKLEQTLSPHLSAGWSFDPLMMAPGLIRDPSDACSHWFYHLDLAQSERLEGETVMYCRDAFTYAAQRQLERHFNGALLPVDLEDAKRGAINAIAKGRAVVSTYMSEKLETELKARGLDVILPKDYGVDDFMVVNGGVHCLTNEV